MNSVSAADGFWILTARPFDPITEPKGNGYARVPVVAWDIFSSADPRPIPICRPYPLAQPALQWPTGQVSCGGTVYHNADSWFAHHVETEGSRAAKVGAA